jgi:hypothetical protein
MYEWRELRIWYADEVSRASLYEYKREVILPALEEFGITSFLFLDQHKFLPLRVRCLDKTFDELFTRLEGDLPPMFTHVSKEIWSPIFDAENRIISAKQRLSGDDYIFGKVGWKILGKDENDQWLMANEDLEKQSEAFSIFMTEVLGSFTKQYIERMPYMVEDRWMLSVFVHLMLDSISVWQDVEGEVREFPYV